MDITELKNKDAGELRELLRQERIKLGKLQFERQAKTLKKSSELGVAKKTIARIQTLLTQRS